MRETSAAFETYWSEFQFNSNPCRTVRMATTPPDLEQSVAVTETIQSTPYNRGVASTADVQSSITCVFFHESGFLTTSVCVLRRLKTIERGIKDDLGRLTRCSLSSLVDYF